MDLEYLVIGIAKQKHEDLVAFYDKTHTAVYTYALSIVKDRFVAREIAVEVYRRVKNLAYKFDTDMNAEYWVLDLTKNISVNALCNGEIAAKAGAHDMSNVSIMVRSAIIDGLEDRGKIVALRLGSSLTKQEISHLLWYNRSSCDSEYRRQIRILAKENEITSKEAETRFAADLENCTPDYLPLIDAETRTIVAEISHNALENDEETYALPGETKDARRLRLAQKEEKRKKKKLMIAGISVAAVIVIAVGVLLWWIANDRPLITPGKDEIPIYRPQYNTSFAFDSDESGIYFRGNKNDGIYYFDSTKPEAEIKQITDVKVREIAIYGDYLYYRADADGRLYRMPKTGGETVKIEERGAIIRFLDGKIVYSSTKGISMMDLDGNGAELIFDADRLGLLREHIEVSDYGAIFFSAGATGGLFRLAKNDEGEYIRYPICEDNTYAFVLAGDRLFLDDDNGDGTGTLAMYTVGENDAFDRFDMKAVLLSAAYDCADGYIYYYGCEKIGADGNAVAKGIYRIDYRDASKCEPGLYTGAPELVIAMENAKYDIADLHIANGYIVSLSSAGEATGYTEMNFYTTGGKTVLTVSGK